MSNCLLVLSLVPMWCAGVCHVAFPRHICEVAKLLMRSPIPNTHVISGTDESEEEPTVPAPSDNETMWSKQMPVRRCDRAKAQAVRRVGRAKTPSESVRGTKTDRFQRAKCACSGLQMGKNKHPAKRATIRR